MCSLKFEVTRVVDFFPLVLIEDSNYMYFLIHFRALLSSTLNCFMRSLYQIYYNTVLYLCLVKFFALSTSCQFLIVLLILYCPYSGGSRVTSNNYDEQPHLCVGHPLPCVNPYDGEHSLSLSSVCVCARVLR